LRFQLNAEKLSHQREFTSDVRRISEMERRLELIRSELVKDEIEISEAEEVPRHPSTRDIIDLEAIIEKSEMEIRELSANFWALVETQKSFLEHLYVLERAEYFLEQETRAFSSNHDGEGNFHLNFIVGALDAEKFSGFERMLWRVSHGNVFVRQTIIETPLENGQHVRK
jgi:V-type H+-transporting ATPase subunit a